MWEGRAAQATLFHRVLLPRRGVGGCSEIEAAEKGRGGGDVGEGQVRGHVLLVSGLGFVLGLPVRPPGACGWGPHRRQSWGGDPRLMALSLWRYRPWERESAALGNEAGVLVPFPDQLTKTRWQRTENPTSAPGPLLGRPDSGPTVPSCPHKLPATDPPALRCLGPPPPTTRPALGTKSGALRTSAATLGGWTPGSKGDGRPRVGPAGSPKHLHHRPEAPGAMGHAAAASLSRPPGPRDEGARPRGVE